MKNSKSVSIIISAYNSASYIAHTLDAVLKQTWQKSEVVVVNDGSTDTTLSILRQYENRGIKIINQSNKGQDAALNEGFRNSAGEYIKFLDSDDLINPEMIELQMKGLDGSEEHIAYGEWARFYNNKPELADFSKLDYWKDMQPMDFLTARPEGVMLQCGIMLVPRKLIEKSGLWDERLILFNDTEFYTRLLLASKGVKFIPGARLYYRSGQSGSLTAQTSRKYFESTYLATCLIGEMMLAAEDSYRVRNLISNMFQYRYHDMYPFFRDLGKKHENMIRQYGNVTIKPQGGKVFKLLNKLLGWKPTKFIQKNLYKLGYLKFIKNKRNGD